MKYKFILILLMLCLLTLGFCFQTSAYYSVILINVSNEIDDALVENNDSNFNHSIIAARNLIMVDQENLLHSNWIDNSSFINFEKSNVLLLRNLLSALKYKNEYPSTKLVYYPITLDNKQLFNDHYPKIGNINESLSLTLLQEDAEPLSFAIQNFSNDIKVKNIKIALKDSNGINFPESHIDIKLVKNWYVGTTHKIEVSPFELQYPVLASELLLKDDALVKVDYENKINYLRVSSNGVESYINVSSPDVLMPSDAQVYDSNELKPFDIPSATARQIWVKFDSHNLSSGLYLGSISVTYDDIHGTEVINIPLNIKILNTKLSSSNMTYGVYYASQLRGETLDATQKNEIQYSAELRNMKDHNILYPTVYVNGDYNGVDDESTIAKYLMMRDKVGLPCDRLYFVSVYGKPKTTVPMLKRLVKENISCSNPKIYLYGVDEAYGETLAKERDKWEDIHAQGAFVFASAVKNDVYDIAGDLLDTLVYRNLSIFPKSTVVNEFRSVGKDVFLYGNPQSGIANPYLYRSGYGFYLLKYNYTGAMNFAYQISFPAKLPYDHGVYKDDRCKNTVGYYCSSWNRFSSDLFYNHMFTFPTSNGVVDTLQWEAYTSSQNDVRYYNTLMNLVKDHCKLGDKCDQENFDYLIDASNPNLSREKIIQQIDMLLKE